MDRDIPVLPVLIVGGGPVGLALAGDLGWRGIPCLLVEQSDGSIFQPRMDFVGVRTMEFCRRWGIVDDVEASPYPRDYRQDNVYLTSMTGYELGREPMPAMDDTPFAPQSPQRRERCPQNMFDPILRKFASSQPGVELRYRTKFEALNQADDGVTVTLTDLETNQTYQVHADYVAGCDGANSSVREALGIGMSGNPALTYTTNVIFRCPDLLSLHDVGKAYRHIFIDTEGTWSTIVAINGRDQWRFSIIGGAEERELSEDDIHILIRQAVGIEFDYEILSVMPWVRRELVADSYRDRRTFILGDAAHVMSPTGGFGMNTGIGDAVDLSWKLDAVLAGWGGDGLLDSYHAERRPVGLRNSRQASANLGRMLLPRSNPALLDDTEEGAETRARLGAEFAEAMRHEWHTMGIHLGYFYDGSPICRSDGTPTPVDDPMTYDQSARPGCRAPHVWLQDGRSTLDLFGQGFVLLRLGPTPPDAADILAEAERHGVPLGIIDIDEADVLDAYQSPLVMIRPDGHVAWRGDAVSDDPAALIDRVRGAEARAV